MIDDSNRQPELASGAFLEHGAFPTTLSFFDVTAKFWTELRKILPAQEVHVVDPYLLDAGGEDPATYAGNIASLLKPALASAGTIVIVHAKARDGIQGLLEKNVAALNRSAQMRFRRGTGMHARYLIADRSRALRMEFSFNRIGKSFGTVSLVEGTEDLAGIVGELNRLDPVASHHPELDPSGIGRRTNPA
ncbi:MAG: hypothetical protein WC558_16375 [Patulibacter sp.]